MTLLYRCNSTPTAARLGLGFTAYEYSFPKVIISSSFRDDSTEEIEKYKLFSGRV